MFIWGEEIELRELKPMRYAICLFEEEEDLYTLKAV